MATAAARRPEPTGTGKRRAVEASPALPPPDLTLITTTASDIYSFAGNHALYGDVDWSRESSRQKIADDRRARLHNLRLAGRPVPYQLPKPNGHNTHTRRQRRKTLAVHAAAAATAAANAAAAAAAPTDAEIAAAAANLAAAEAAELAADRAAVGITI